MRLPRAFLIVRWEGGAASDVVCKVLYISHKIGVEEILVGKEEGWKVPAEAG